MPIGPSALSAECTQVRKICCALSAECTPELGVMSAVQSAVVHCVWCCLLRSRIQEENGQMDGVQGGGDGQSDESVRELNAWTARS